MFEICSTSSRRKKQVYIDLCLVSKDSDTESENLSSLIRLSVSDVQKTDSSVNVSFVGIITDIMVNQI